MNANSNAKVARPAAVRSAKTWGVSREEWLAYERDMDSQNDHDRWIAEMEGEASEAGKLTADLNTSNAPF